MNNDLKLNKEQKEAIEYGEGPLLIVAGAGTGKTTVLTQRAFYLLEKKACPRQAAGVAMDLQAENVLALTFTEKAANEMEERLDVLLPYAYTDLWVMTFHSFCQRILEDNGLDIGLPSNFKVLDQTGIWMLIRKNLDRFDLDYYRPLGNPTKFIKEMIKHFSRCKDELIQTKNYLEYAEKIRLNQGQRLDEETQFETKRLEEIANAYHTYQQILLDEEVLDFGDLINYTIKLFKERPNILKKYREQFKYILVDEFQDTNYAQYELVKLLAHPKNNITVVGDDDQSIYAFRGSSMNNILGFKKDYPNTQEIFLTQNYRSAQNVLDLAYDFIQQNNPNRLEIKLSQGKNKLSKKLQAFSSEAGEIEVIKAQTENDEVNELIKKIYSVLKKEKDLSWNDFAILVRSNSQAKPFTIGLEEANIPYNFVASSGLYEKEIVMDIMAYLKLLDNYHESSAVWRVLNLKCFDINPRQAVNFSHMARKKTVSLYEVIKNHHAYLKLSENTIKAIEKITGLVDKHSRLISEQSVWKIIWAFLIDSGYLKWIDALSEARKQEIFSYLNQFYKKVQVFEKQSDSPKVKDFLEFFKLETESGEKGKLASSIDDGPESVKVMTVHGAKGLEFKYVFVVGLVDKRFPSLERSEKIQIPDALIKETLLEGDIHLQEERRLFYVAMTRAKKGLYFTWALDYGGMRLKRPSIFLKELNLIKLEEDLAKDNQIDFNKLSSEIFEDTRKINKEDLQKLLPKQFSFSQLNAYNTCPRQYYYAHILKIPSLGKHVFSYGKSMHLTLQKFFQLIKFREEKAQGDLFATTKIKDTQNKKSRLPVSLEELLKIYEDVWIDDWYENKKDKKEYLKKGRETLREIYKDFEKNPPQVKFLEKGFNVHFGDYSFKGNIDRVDKIKGGIQLVDYKTGKTKEKLSLADKEQLLIYQMAFEEVFKEKVKNLKFHYLNNNSQIDFLGTDKELEKIREKLIQTIKKINTCNFQAKPSEYKCQYCDFKDICPFKI